MSADEAAVAITGGAVVVGTRREEVVRRVRHALLAGELKPGQRIKEAPLAESLGVSRPTLRESLRLAKEPRSTTMDEVRTALDRHLAAIEAGDDVQTDITHFELHRTIWEMSGNVTLRKIWPLVGSQIQRALSLDQATMRDPARDAELHRRLIRVIEEGDEDAIVAEVRAHIQYSVDEVVRRLT
jgi:DNA-binding GntR family transcriptional regulator